MRMRRRPLLLIPVTWIICHPIAHCEPNGVPDDYQRLGICSAHHPLRPDADGHLSPRRAGKYPGVVLFSEIFQITGPIRRTAALLAGHGFVVAVPEVFHELEAAPGCVLAYDQAGADRGNSHKTTKELASYDADARAVLDYLKAQSNCTAKLGSVGICIGGHLSFRCAMNPDVLAGICFYPTDIHKAASEKECTTIPSTASRR